MFSPWKVLGTGKRLQEMVDVGEELCRVAGFEVYGQFSRREFGKIEDVVDN